MVAALWVLWFYVVKVPLWQGRESYTENEMSFRQSDTGTDNTDETSGSVQSTDTSYYATFVDKDTANPSMAFALDTFAAMGKSPSKSPSAMATFLSSSTDSDTPLDRWKRAGRSALQEVPEQQEYYEVKVTAVHQ